MSFESIQQGAWGSGISRGTWLDQSSGSPPLSRTGTVHRWERLRRQCPATGTEHWVLRRCAEDGVLVPRENSLVLDAGIVAVRGDPLVQLRQNPGSVRTAARGGVGGKVCRRPRRQLGSLGAERLLRRSNGQLSYSASQLVSLGGDRLAPRPAAERPVPTLATAWRRPPAGVEDGEVAHDAVPLMGKEGDVAPRR